MNIKDELIYYLRRVLTRDTLQNTRHLAPYKIFDEKKFIFIHIPKNAGISIAKSLIGEQVGHMTALTFRAIFGKKNFEEYFKFTFVRNPFTRLVSAYEFLQNGGYGPSDIKPVSIVRQYRTLEDFVLQYLSPTTAKALAHFRPQHHFICDSFDNIMVNYIGRFEHLDTDYEYIREKTGIGESLKKINITKNKKQNKDDYYNNSRVIQKVIEIYAKDFDLFEYKKNTKNL